MHGGRRSRLILNRISGKYSLHFKNPSGMSPITLEIKHLEFLVGKTIFTSACLAPTPFVTPANEIQSAIFL